MAVMALVVSACADSEARPSPSTESVAHAQAPRPERVVGDVSHADLRRMQSTRLRVLCFGDLAELPPNGDPTETVAGVVVARLVSVTRPDAGGDDNRGEFIADVECSTTGRVRSTSSTVVVLRRTDLGMVQLGTPVSGSAPTWSSDTLLVRRPIYRDSDPQCCPSATMIVPLRWTAGDWNEVESTRRLATVLDAAGLGGLALRRSPRAVAARLRRSVVERRVEGATCTTLHPAGDGIPPIHAVVVRRRVVALHVDGPGVRSAEGIGIGSTADAVTRLHPVDANGSTRVVSVSLEHATMDYSIEGGRVVGMTLRTSDARAIEPCLHPDG